MSASQYYPVRCFKTYGAYKRGHEQTTQQFYYLLTMRAVGLIFLVTTHRRIAILRVLWNPIFSNMPNVPLHRNELEVLSPV